jgi:Cu(I)/Ag(I) efflux system membrane fusion protein
MSKRVRILTAAGLAAVVLAVTTVLALRPKQNAPTQADPAAQEMEGMAGMTGMEGMQGMQGMEMGGMNMGGGTISLTIEEIRTFGITYGTADVRPLTRSIRTVGLVEFDETRMAYVSPKFAGWVERLHVDFTWQAVREGQPLVDVYSPELVTAQEELLLAASLADSVGQSPVAEVARGAAGLLEETKRRLLYWDISEDQIDEILRTRTVRKALTLHAPVSGVVMRKDALPGQAFGPGHNLYMIADLGTVWIQGEVFESDAALIRSGMSAGVTLAALPGRTFRGRVDYVYPTLEQETRSMKVRVTLSNPTGEVKPGMYATVSFEANLGEVLTLPASAVLRTGTRNIAFVDMGGGTLMPHEVTLGQRGGDYIQVLEGVEPGMRVVTSAQYLLDSESNLAEVMRAMMAQMNMSDMGAMDMDMPGMNMPGMQDMPEMQPPGGGRE